MKTRQVFFVAVGIVILLAACKNPFWPDKKKHLEDPAVTWPDNLQGLYGKTLADISLASINAGTSDGTFFWTEPGTALDSLGSRPFSMTYTPDEDGRYSTVTNEVLVRVMLVAMAPIPGATFTMGSAAGEAGRRANETSRAVTLNAFSMGKYEITQEQYVLLTHNNPSYFTQADGTENVNKLPVESVSWFDAVEFCNKLSEEEGFTKVYTINNRTPATGYPITSADITADWNADGYRLPTEAEWEHACRAGTTTAFNTGNSIADKTGWYAANSGDRVHQVGLKSANSFGLYDMHGNVWEWCWDWYGDYAGTDNPKGPASDINRVSRGGGWIYEDIYARSAYRGISTPDDQHEVLGFRVVKGGN